MKLRFEVDQAEAFRRGVNCPKKLVTVEVDPADLSQSLREKIAARMVGADVYCARVDSDLVSLTILIRPARDRLLASLPTWEGFLEALREDEARIAPDIADIQTGFELIKRSGVKLSAEVAGKGCDPRDLGSVDSLIALQEFIDSPKAPPSHAIAESVKDPSLN